MSTDSDVLLELDGLKTHFFTDEGVVRVRLLGACAGCPGAMMTLKMGVERILKEKLEGVQSVEAVPF